MKDITNYQNEQELGYKLVEKFLELAKEYKNKNVILNESLFEIYQLEGNRHYIIEMLIIQDKNACKITASIPNENENIDINSITCSVKTDETTIDEMKEQDLSRYYKYFDLAVKELENAELVGDCDPKRCEERIITGQGWIRRIPARKNGFLIK